MADIIPFEGNHFLRKSGELPSDSVVYSDELKSTAFRRALITSDVGILCVGKAQKGLDVADRVVIFLCDSKDPFGYKYLTLFNSEDHIKDSLSFNSLKLESAKPLQLICFSADLPIVKDRTKSLYPVILDRMAGLLGYFPVIVCADEGYTVFPWPFSLKKNAKIDVLTW